MKRAMLLVVLGCLPAAKTADKPPHRICEGPPGSILGGPSPDGRALSCVDPETGDLALIDLESGKRRRLTRKRTDSGEFAYFSVVSPDSRRVAYAWFNDAKFYELRVVSIDGAEPRVLYRNEEAGFVQPSAWSPDGRQILTLLFRRDSISQIALVSAEDGSVRVLKSLNWVYPKKMDFSPDGRFIVYDSPARDGGRARDIFVLAADGSREVPLVEDPANDLFPLWAPDGKRVFFASDRSGTMDLWTIAVGDGRPRSAPALVRRGLDRFLPMGMTRAGRLFYGLRTDSSDVYVASFDPSSGRLLSRAVAVSRGRPGGNSAPEWSPDGSELAYLSRRGTENFGADSRVITIRTLATGEERDLEARLAHVERLRWSPDGRSLLAAGSDRRSLGGLYRIDARSGEVEPLVQDERASFRGLEGLWSFDGRSIVYALDSEIRLRVLETRQETPLERAAARGRVRNLALSPDGQWLGFVAGAGSGGDVVAVVPIAGGAARELLRLNAGEPTDLEWTRDGRRILVTVTGEAGLELRSVPVGAGQAVRAQPPPDWQGGLRVGPDGRRVAFAAGQSRSEVWAVDDLLR